MLRSPLPKRGWVEIIPYGDKIAVYDIAENRDSGAIVAMHRRHRDAVVAALVWAEKYRRKLGASVG